MSIWYNPAVRGWAAQGAVLLLLVVAFGYFIHNALENMARVGVSSGFTFLGRPANFAIGETMFAYSSADSYGRAILIGLANTVKVALLGCFFATIIGTILGVLRLSTNVLLRGLAQTYIEVARNIPLLLHLFFWYTIIQLQFPRPKDALHPLPGVFLSNRGIKLPLIEADEMHWWLFGAVLAGLLATLLVGRLNRQHQVRTGIYRPTWPWGLAFIVAAPALFAKFAGIPFVVEMPELQGFNFVGGATMSPEFSALLIGLSFYTAAFIAEIVRSGIQSVSQGQREAARSLGLTPTRTMRMVILPQALRVIVPPLTSSYLGLTKNSSLAVAIGYPDLVNVVNTTMNQTGQAVETMAILMGTYLALSLAISLFMNWYNRKIAIKER